MPDEASKARAGIAPQRAANKPAFVLWLFETPAIPIPAPGDRAVKPLTSMPRGITAARISGMIKAKWTAAAWIAATALLAIVPMALAGASCGHDLNFHLLSWMEVSRAWHQGIAYPHWVHAANYGAGEPRLVFYPPGSWFFGALLGRIVPWSAVPALFVFAVLWGCGSSMYLLARQWLPKAAAVLAACLYIVSPYTFFVAYERSAFGELMAAIWFPLIFLCLLRKQLSFLPLGLAIAAVWLSNVPAAIVATYAVIILSLALTLAERRARPFLRAGGGIALGMCLAAFYLVPAVYERRWIESGRALAFGLNVDSSFLFGRTGDPFHIQVLRTASLIFTVEIALTFAALWVCGRALEGSIRRTLAAVSLFALFLQFPASQFLWRRLPELAFIQFPWRWLLTINVIASLAIAGAVYSLASRICKASNRVIWPTIVCVLALASIVMVQARLFFQACDGEDTIAAQSSAFLSGEGSEGTDEYTSAGADNSSIQRGLPFLRLLRGAQDDAVHSEVDNPKWEPAAENSNLALAVQAHSDNGEQWTIRVDSDAPGYAVLRLMDYPEWHVTRNGRVVLDRPRREDGLMTIPVTAGLNVIQIRWSGRDAAAGRALSGLSAIVLLAVFTLSLKKREDPWLAPSSSPAGGGSSGG